MTQNKTNLNLSVVFDIQNSTTFRGLILFASLY